jgi:hydrogenase-4 component F
VTAVLLVVLIAPLAAAVGCLTAPARACQAITTTAGLAAFAAVIALVPAATRHDVTLGRYLRADAISVIFLLAISFLYAAVAAYSIGYLRADAAAPDFPRYARRFYAGLNLFAWSMLAAPLMSSLALLWIAIEVTTVVSALLVAIEDTDGAVEAAWKYVLIASAGLGLALLATIFAYAAGAHVLGQSYDLTFAALLRAGPHLPHTAVRLAFVLAVLGFGTKVGLFPVHTWLPDTHSEAPTPVSALLSGSLLAVSF